MCAVRWICSHPRVHIFCEVMRFIRTGCAAGLMCVSSPVRRTHASVFSWGTAWAELRKNQGHEMEHSQ